MLDYLFLTVFVVAAAVWIYSNWRAGLLASGAFEAPQSKRGPWEKSVEQARVENAEQERRYHSLARTASYAGLAVALVSFVVSFGANGWEHFYRQIPSVKRPDDKAVGYALLTAYRVLALLSGVLVAIVGAVFLILSQRHRRLATPFSIKFQAYTGRGVLYISVARKCAGMVVLILLFVAVFSLALQKA